MSISNKSLVDRRRIIYSALVSHLSKDRLLEALWLWEQKYSRSDGSELRNFVTEISDDKDSPEFKNNVYKSITKITFFTINQDLLQDPYDAMVQYKRNCNGTFKYSSPSEIKISTSPSTVIFQHLVDNIFAPIKKEHDVDVQMVIHQLMRNLLDKELGAENKIELREWLGGKVASLKLSYDEKFMSSFINEIYVLCCQQFGPVGTDKWLARSVSMTAKLKEAKLYPPEKLL
jgi:hypothetical protein